MFEVDERFVGMTLEEALKAGMVIRPMRQEDVDKFVLDAIEEGFIELTDAGHWKVQ